VRAKVLLEDVGVGKNVAKVHVAQEYFPAHSRIKLWKGHL